MVYNYDDKVFTRPVAQAEAHRSFIFADHLLDEINLLREGKVVVNTLPSEHLCIERHADVLLQNTSRPIIFVGHSLGGFVIKAVSDNTLPKWHTTES